MRQASDLAGLAVAVALTLASGPSAARAQDTHYWTVQSGARANLLGGAVVADDHDLSAAFYNPAGLVRIEREAALSTFVRMSTRVTLEVDAASALVAESNVGSSAPGFFAVRLSGVPLVNGDALTFSYLVRQSSKLDMSGLAASEPGVLPATAVDLSVGQDLYDGWYGLSWATGSATASFGASLYYSSVSQRQRIQTADVSILAPGDGSATVDELQFAFSVRRLIAKVGAEWSTGPVTLGGAVTLPSLRLPFSSGTLTVGHSTIPLDSVSPSELTKGRQEGIDANFRHPISVALGATVSVGSLEILSSAEWFASVDGYDVLDTEPLTAQLPPATLEVPIRQARESVLNVGLGAAWQATSFLSVFGSARTDNSFKSKEARSVVGLAGYDLTHVTAGFGIATGPLELWLGILRSTGSSNGEAVPSPLPSAPLVRVRTEHDGIGLLGAFSASF